MPFPTINPAMRRNRMLVSAFLCATAPVAAQEDTPHPIAIRGVTVVDVETGRLRPDHTVLIEQNRIAAVGARGNVPVPAAARVIDGAGRYLIPGLVDTHAHLFGPWKRNWPYRSRPTAASLKRTCGRFRT